MAITSTGGAVDTHPILEALNAAKEKGNSLDVLAANFAIIAINRMAGSTRIFWDYVNKQFVAQGKFGETIFLHQVNTRRLGAAAQAAANDRRAAELAELIAKSARSSINRKRLELIEFHMSHTTALNVEAETSSHSNDWPYTGYVMPEWVAAHADRWLTDQRVITAVSSWECRGKDKSVGSPWMDNFYQSAFFEGVANRMRERLDAEFQLPPTEAKPSDSLKSYYAHRFGRQAFMDWISQAPRTRGIQWIHDDIMHNWKLLLDRGRQPVLTTAIREFLQSDEMSNVFEGDRYANFTAMLEALCYFPEIFEGRYALNLQQAVRDGRFRKAFLERDAVDLKIDAYHHLPEVHDYTPTARDTMKLLDKAVGAIKSPIVLDTYGAAWIQIQPLNKDMSVSDRLVDFSKTCKTFDGHSLPSEYHRSLLIPLEVLDL